MDLPFSHRDKSASKNACKSYIYALIMTQKILLWIMLPSHLCVHNTPFMRPFTILIAAALTYISQASIERRFSFKDFQFITGLIYDDYLQSFYALWRDRHATNTFELLCKHTKNCNFLILREGERPFMCTFGKFVGMLKLHVEACKKGVFLMEKLWYALCLTHFYILLNPESCVRAF